MKYLFILIILVLQSCASYVDSFHKQIDRDERAQYAPRQPIRSQPGAPYPPPGTPTSRFDKRPIQDPRSYSNITANTQPNYYDGPQREYQQSGGRRRHRSSDLVDGGNQASLWGNNNEEGFLFNPTLNKLKVGDILVIDVMASLKNQISEELKRAFPDAPKRPGTAQKTEEDTSKAEEKEDDLATDENKVYDKISAAVVEEINKDFLLIRGKKEVIFKKVKRFLEIQSLVSKRDITDNNQVSSNKILDPRIMIVR
jgi:hypothetical protein